MQISPQVTGWKQSTRSLKFRLLLRLEEISGSGDSHLLEDEPTVDLPHRAVSSPR